MPDITEVSTIERLAEDFDTCVFERSPFSPEVAQYYAELNEIPVSESATKESAMLSAQEMTPDQQWKIFCNKEDGKTFARNFQQLCVAKRLGLERLKFEALVSCLDKTNEIINSVMDKDGA